MRDHKEHNAAVASEGDKREPEAGDKPKRSSTGARLVRHRELVAMEKIDRVLAEFDETGRVRILSWVLQAHGQDLVKALMAEAAGAIHAAKAANNG